MKSLAPLCEPLYDSLTSARALAHDRLPQLGEHPRARPAFVHVVRGLALIALEQHDLGAWSLRPQNNAGIKFCDGPRSLRLLHLPRTGDVPAAGTNRRRRVEYVNDTLHPEMLPSNESLLGLWSTSPGGAIEIRVVRPVGVWNYGARALVDLDFTLPALGGELAALAFESVDEDIHIPVPKEDDTDGRAGLGS